jgi:hypothetical protein
MEAYKHAESRVRRSDVMFAYSMFVVPRGETSAVTLPVACKKEAPCVCHRTGPAKG